MRNKEGEKGMHAGIGGFNKGVLRTVPKDLGEKEDTSSN